MASWRYIAQRALTGEFLDWELPVSDPKLTRRLCGPWGMTGTIVPEYGRLVDEQGDRLLDEWGTHIWAECDGIIRGGGILTSSKPVGSSWSLTVDGFTRYPYGMTYRGHYRRVGVDPLDIVREIWSHLQAQPDGDLGLTIGDASSPVRVGTDDEPYELLYWEDPDCGDEIETLQKEAGFEYVEQHAWSTTVPDTIEHRMPLAYPRLGRRRDDLAFVEGENMAALPEPERDGDRFANVVYGFGKGEGRRTVRTGAVGARDGRLRRTHVLDRKDVGSARRLRRLAAREWRSRRHIGRIPLVVVRDHANARLGSWELGDEVFVEAHAGWSNESGWYRITGDTLSPGADRMALSLIRADAA